MGIIFHFATLSNPLNGSTVGPAQNSTNKRIKPLSDSAVVYLESTKRWDWKNPELFINQIESLSGDPLSGLHYSSIMST